MSTTILLKRNSVVGQAPLVADLTPGEVAINTVDGFIYSKINISGYGDHIARVPVHTVLASYDEYAVTFDGDVGDTVLVVAGDITANFPDGSTILLQDAGGATQSVTVTSTKPDIHATIINFTPASILTSVLIKNNVVFETGTVIKEKIFVEEPAGTYTEYGANAPTGLEKLNEGSGFGWALIDRWSPYYQPIGLAAVDVSFASHDMDLHGASGSYSFGSGYETHAGGIYSFAGGYSSKATGITAFAFGANALASGENATAFGSQVQASGEASFGIGGANFVSGVNSFVGGRKSNVSGDESFAFQGGGLSTATIEGDRCAVLGGIYNRIVLGVEDTAVLAGTSVLATQSNMVYVPALKFVASPAAPSAPELGTLYFSDFDDRFEYWDGTQWINMTPLTFNTLEGVYEFDSDVTGVKNQIGLEDWTRVINNTGISIANAKVVYYTGVSDDTSEISLASNNVPAIVHRVAGVTTSTIGHTAKGFITSRGYVRGFDTTHLDFTGPVYLGLAGGLTMVKPVHPAVPVIIGGLIKKDAIDGVINVGMSGVQERSLLVKSYGFTSQGIGSGVYYKAGYYDFAATDANLTQAALTVTYGDPLIAYSAHAYGVAGGPGTVDTGVVGLKVSGTKIDDSGTKVPGFSETLIPDITAVALNETFEGAKFLGTVTFELFVVSGTPVNYSFDFNYGYAKYEDFGNRDFYLVGLECIWQGGAADLTGFDIQMIHHNPLGWTYAATGFVAGGTVIAQRSVDQVGFLKVAGDIDTAWKRTGMNTHVHGSESEGVIYKVTTGSNNTIQTMDLHIGVALD